MDSSHSTNKPLKELVLLVTSWTENDQVCEIINRKERLKDPRIAEHVTQHYLLKRDPLWCGLLLFNFRMVAHEGAIVTASSWSFILATAHLYNSLRQAGILHSRWRDMEHIVSMHRAENLYIGEPPKTFEACSKRFALAMGMSASNLARNRRSHIGESSGSKIRKLEMLAPVSWSFKSRLCDSDRGTGLGPSEIMQVLSKTFSRKGLADIKLDFTVDICRIVFGLSCAMQLEASELTFNHFEMHIMCWGLLRSVHKALRGNLPEWSELYRDHRDLPSLVLYLLTGAAKDEKVRVALGVDASSTPTNVMSRVAEVLEIFVAQSGDHAQRGLHERSVSLTEQKEAPT